MNFIKVARQVFSEQLKRLQNINKSLLTRIFKVLLNGHKVYLLIMLNYWLNIFYNFFSLLKYTLYLRIDNKWYRTAFIARNIYCWNFETYSNSTKIKMPLYLNIKFYLTNVNLNCFHFWNVKNWSYLKIFLYSAIHCWIFIFLMKLLNKVLLKEKISSYLLSIPNLLWYGYEY